MKQSKRISVLLMVLVLCAGILSACTSGGNNTSPSSTAPAASTPSGDSSEADGSTDAPATPDVDLSKEANLVYYLWGDPAKAHDQVFNEINAKLKEDLNTTLTVNFIGWNDVATKYPLLFASGEQFDLSHVSPNAAVSYYTLASQDVLVDITDMLSLTPALKAAIPDAFWKASQYNNRIYSVPCDYSEFTPYGYAYRVDLLEKYGMDAISSLDDMVAYMQAVVDNESFEPINGTSVDAQNLYRIFVDLTSTWVEAPGIPAEQFYLVATDYEHYDDIIHPAFTQEFEDWAVMMREWADAGYFPKDILSAQINAKDNTHNALSGGYLTHMPDWTGAYGVLQQSVLDSEIDFWCPADDTGKVRTKSGSENATAISVNSKNPERALMVLEKFLTDESYYRLMQYGIEGLSYEIVDGTVVYPEGYNKDTDEYGISAWALRTDNFNIPYATEDPRRYELIDLWRTTAIPNPFTGFNVDTANIQAELSTVANVNSQIGIQIMLGKTPMDPVEAVAQYRDQLTTAGVDTIIAEVKAQLADFTPVV